MISIKLQCPDGPLFDSWLYNVKEIIWSPIKQNDVEKSRNPVPNTDTFTADDANALEGDTEYIMYEETVKLVSKRAWERDNTLTEPLTCT